MHISKPELMFWGASMACGNSLPFVSTELAHVQNKAALALMNSPKTSSLPVSSLEPNLWQLDSLNCPPLIFDVKIKAHSSCRCCKKELAEGEHLPCQTPDNIRRHWHSGRLPLQPSSIFPQVYSWWKMISLMRFSPKQTLGWESRCAWCTL